MLRDFLDRVLEVARRADSIEVVRDDAIPEMVFVRKGEAYADIAVPPGRRRHVVSSFYDLVAFAKDDASMSPSPIVPEVFHDEDGVVVHLDRGDRRDFVTMPLSWTSRWGILASLSEGRKMSVRDAVRFLRFDLHDVGADSVVSALRRVDFHRRSDGSVSVEHGKESLGRSVEAAVQGAESIPDSFHASTSIYSNFGLRDASSVTVTVGIHLDVASEQVEFRTFADEMNDAQNAVVATIGSKLREGLPGVPVYHGTP